MSKEGFYWFLCGFGLGLVAALMWAMPQQLEMARRVGDLEAQAAAIRAELRMAEDAREKTLWILRNQGLRLQVQPEAK